VQQLPSFQVLDVHNAPPLLLFSSHLSVVTHALVCQLVNKFDDAAWVANRWVELLDLPLLQKQRLMQLDSPILRLELINDILDKDTPKPH
jgi:Lon protease-like protein